MIVYIDESGNCGMKPGGASTPLFVVAAVLFRTPDDAQFADRQIARHKEAVGFAAYTEFKFNKCNRAIREGFFESIADCRFDVYTMAIDKSKLWPHSLWHKPESFYRETVKYVCENMKEELVNAKVVLDRCGGREFRQQLQTGITRLLNDKPLANGQKRVRKTQCEASHTNNLIQLADMVVGAAHRTFRTDKTDHRVYWTYLEKRCKRWRKWP